MTFVKNVLNAFDSNLDLKNSIGLDYSSSCFAVDNHGLRYDVPHFLRSNLDSIKKMMICLEKYEKGSDDYNAIIRKLRKLHRKIANRRKDFLHKLSCEIAENYDYVFVEDLDMNQYTGKSNLSRATYDNSYAKFVNMLQYKLEDKGKKLVKVNRYFASSKICSECGCLNENLKLNEKNWTCPHCGSYLDRDVNAAVNIRKEGMRKVKEESWNQ
ncbi:MAG: RNA-guided endonuclease TnpB family protein [Solobacterium sp.]|nr:RNA-guided endonuclease TnpB family protein [Solobacterium sp.]